MNTIDIINDIKEQTGTKLTPAQICYELKRAASGLTEDKIKSYQSEPLSPNQRKDALDNISNFLTNREAENQMSLPKIENTLIQDDNKLQKSDEIKSSNKLSEPETNNKAANPPTSEEVKRFVIPVIADKIITNAKNGTEPNTVTYNSDNFSAMLILEDEQQTISLDRKNAEPENTNALIASKGNNQQEYQIIINNISRHEFERFKALFEKASQKQIEKENNKGSELN
ncbi:MAG: hypothetical protein HC815_05630 [Richelia sp. RM1_1_1]|nr:hypothetical protein [Richelia sp. RM1_1_1]